MQSLLHLDFLNFLPIQDATESKFVRFLIASFKRQAYNHQQMSAQQLTEQGDETDGEIDNLFLVSTNRDRLALVKGHPHLDARPVVSKLAPTRSPPLKRSVVPLQTRLRFQADGLSERLAKLVSERGGPVNQAGIRAVFDTLISFGDGANSSATSTITEHAMRVST